MQRKPSDFLVIPFALLALAAWFIWPYLFLPEGTSTISLFHAEKTFTQCSRDAPQEHGRYWVPTARQILRMELAMVRVMIEREKAGLKIPLAGYRYHGQYIGYTARGVRYIYGNHFVSEYEPGFFDGGLLEKPMIMCDGGRTNWGMVYNVEQQKIEQPVFNGG